MKDNVTEQVMGEETAPKHWRWSRTLFRLSVLSIIIYFWTRYLRSSWDELGSIHWRLDWASVFLSGLTIVFGYLLMAWLWAPLCHEIAGIRLSAKDAFRISSLAWMGRYIPGKVWAVVGKVYLTTNDTGQMPSVGVAATIESIWLQLSGLMLAMVVLPLCRHVDFLPGNAEVASTAILVLALTAVHPRVFCPIVNFVLRLLRLDPLPRRPRYSILLRIMLGYMGVFALWSTGFAVFTNSITELQLSDVPTFWVIVPFAWAIGFFSLLAPAGLGVRDSILALALDHMFQAAPADVLVVVIGTRVLTTVVEFGCFLVGLALSYLDEAHGTRKAAPHNA